MLIITIVLFILVFDHYTKWYIRTSFDIYQSKPVIENFFHLTYVTNDGMAFGLSFPGGKSLLLLVTIILTIFIIFLLYNEKNGHPLIKYGLSLILGGAFGNLIDRMIFGKVVDFVDIMFGDYHWYIFNVADSAVTVGMVLFILHTFIVNENAINQD